MKRITGILLAMAFAAPVARAAEQPSATVVVEPVQMMRISPTVPVTGTVYSRHDVQITLGVEGRLEFVAEPGTHVAQGDVIARIDTVPLELDRAEFEAQAERARAQLRFLDSQLARQRDLAGRNVLAVNELEQTQSQRDVAASDLRIAELRLRQVEEQLQRAIVRAEFDGVIAERLHRAGEDLARGTVVARLVDTERLEVRVLVPLRHQGRIAAGDTLRLFGFERETQGTVRSIVPATDPRQQAFELLIDISPDGNAAWSVGELVSVAIPLRAASDVLAVPRDALILRQEGSFVYRVSSDGTAQRIAVTVGESGTGERIAVEGDLRAGDRVVVRGGESLTPDQPVRVLDPRESAIAARATPEESDG